MHLHDIATSIFYVWYTVLALMLLTKLILIFKLLDLTEKREI